MNYTWSTWKSFHFFFFIFFSLSSFVSKTSWEWKKNENGLIFPQGKHVYILFWRPNAFVWLTLLAKDELTLGFFSCVFFLLCMYSIENCSPLENGKCAGSRVFVHSLSHCHLLWMKCPRIYNECRHWWRRCRCRRQLTVNICIASIKDCSLMSFPLIICIWTGDNSR